MSQPKGYQGQVGSMVQNTAAIDTFTAPDSLARRPNPESKEDRDRCPQQPFPTAIEANLPQE